MAPILRLSALFLFLIECGFAQQQKIQWQMLFGGTGFDFGFQMEMTPDGCFVMAGHTLSKDGDADGNHLKGAQDILVIKVSSEGETVWKRCLGGTKYEELQEFRATNDGGFILIGTTESTDGDVTNNHGKYDMWVVKLDVMGNIQWQRCLGGPGNDMGYAVCQTSDSCFIIGGESGSNTGDFYPHRNGLDAWYAKLDPQGNLIWKRNWGGMGNEKITFITEVDKKQILLLGTSDSKDGDIPDPIGEQDVFVLVVSKNNDFVWQRRYGGTMNDDIHGMLKDDDGNFIFCGTTFSADGDLESNNGLGDIWLFKTNKIGDLRWSYTYGGSRSEGAWDLISTKDGFMVGGMTSSHDKFVPRFRGTYDALLIKTDKAGELQWTQTWGGKDFECLSDMKVLPNGNFLGFGYAESPDADLLPTGKVFGADFWLFEFSEEDKTQFIHTSSPYLTGYVTDKETGMPLQTEIIVTDNDSLREMHRIWSLASNGTYYCMVPKKSNLSVNYVKPGYMLFGQNIALPDGAFNPQIRIDAVLDPIKVGKKYPLRNIYFDAGKWTLRKESNAELERLVKFMGINPTVTIQVNGHTDNTGSAEDKLELSINRALEVKYYLLKRGIKTERVECKGFGASQPVASNDTPDGRQLNRRVEVEITHE